MRGSRDGRRHGPASVPPDRKAHLCEPPPQHTRYPGCQLCSPGPRWAPQTGHRGAESQGAAALPALPGCCSRHAALCLGFPLCLVPPLDSPGLRLPPPRPWDQASQGAGGGGEASRLASPRPTPPPPPPCPKGAPSRPDVRPQEGTVSLHSPGVSGPRSCGERPAPLPARDGAVSPPRGRRGLPSLR